VPASWTFARSGSPDSGATRNDQLGRQALHHLVSLIARQASHSGDTSIWPGSRGSNVQDSKKVLNALGRTQPEEMVMSQPLVDPVMLLQ
jgi:hypothetical protein